MACMGSCLWGPGIWPETTKTTCSRMMDDATQWNQQPPPTTKPRDHVAAARPKPECRKVGCNRDIEHDCFCECPNIPTAEVFCASKASSRVCNSKILVRMFRVGGCGCHCSFALRSKNVYSRSTWTDFAQGPQLIVKRETNLGEVDMTEARRAGANELSNHHHEMLLDCLAVQ